MMRLLSSACVLFGVCFAGELITRLFALPIPGSVVGMLLLLLLLCCRVVKPEQLEALTKPLLSHMTLLFVPAGAGIMVSFGMIKESLAAFLIISAVGAAAVLALTGVSVELVQRRLSRRGKEEDGHE